MASRSASQSSPSRRRTASSSPSLATQSTRSAARDRSAARSSSSRRHWVSTCSASPISGASPSTARLGPLQVAELQLQRRPVDAVGARRGGRQPGVTADRRTAATGSASRGRSSVRPSTIAASTSWACPILSQVANGIRLASPVMMCSRAPACGRGVRLVPGVDDRTPDRRLQAHRGLDEVGPLGDLEAGLLTAGPQPDPSGALGDLRATPGGPEVVHDPAERQRTGVAGSSRGSPRPAPCRRWCS